MTVRTRQLVWSRADVTKARDWLLRSTMIANDIETIPFDKKKKNQKVFTMTVNSFTGINKDGDLGSFCFPYQNAKSPLAGTPDALDEIYEANQEINDSGIPFTYQNGAYDLAWLLRYGLPVRNYAYDSMTMFWSRWPDLPKRLDFISSILLDDYQYWKGDRKQDDFLVYCNYAMSDTEYTLRNTLRLIYMMERDPKMRLNNFHAHLRVLSGLAMSMQGLAVDMEVMGEIERELRADAAEKLATLRFLVADPAFNPNSPQQKKELIYGLLGARFRGPKGKFVKRIEDASTGAIVLRAMRSDHPIYRTVANAIIDAGTPAKQISNVVGIAMFPAGPTGSRLITSYDGVGTTTSRYSSRASAFGHGANKQNIRKVYRRFARADPGTFYFEIDFSASDDVFVAFESGEQKKIDLVRSGRDTHATNALIFFSNWTYDAIVAGKAAADPRVVHPITGVRQVTKKVVHGCHYLMAGSTLLASAGREAIIAAALERHLPAANWTQDECVAFCDIMDEEFREWYPRFKREGHSGSWYSDLRAEVVRTGGFTTAFGYFQRFLSDPHDDSTLRAVAATAGQAGTAGRINMAMDELIHGYIPARFRDGPNPHAREKPRQVSRERNGVIVKMQTHDSLSVQGDPSHPNIREGIESVFEVFNRPVVIRGEEFRVGTEADVSIYWSGKEGRVVKNYDEIESWWAELSATKPHLVLA